MTLFRKKHPPVGARPGTLVISEAAPPPKIRAMVYSPEGVEETDASELDAVALRSLVRDGHVAWIDVQGLGDEGVIRGIGEAFSIHPLALEDIVNTPQRPKAEPYDEHLLFIMRMIKLREDAITQREQLSIIWGSDYILTFQERYGDVFDPVRRRIREGKNRPIRQHGPDYLAYALIDAVVDGYYPVMEQMGEHLEELEQEILEAPSAAVMHNVHQAKRELLAMRRAIWPLREAISSLVRGEFSFVSGEVRVFLRDCYDHCVQVLDVVETYRELTGGLLDMYLSSIGNRQNEIMKVLTIMASIFIPLTFLAGIYGMNFEYMPELAWRWAYPGLLGVMLLAVAGMVLYFRRKGWIGKGRLDALDEEA